jgi:hypothetical protein
MEVSNVRVNYTLPGFLPAEASPGDAIRAGDGPFRARLQFVPPPRWADWKSLLRLDQPAVSASTIGPPPRPAGLDISDAATQRLIWRQMLDRQVIALEDDPLDAIPADGKGNRALKRMLVLLVGMQEAEDEIAGRRLAEPEG